MLNLIKDARRKMSVIIDTLHVDWIRSVTAWIEANSERIGLFRETPYTGAHDPGGHNDLQSEMARQHIHKRKAALQSEMCSLRQRLSKVWAVFPTLIRG